jgi:hypothetical protein
MKEIDLNHDNLLIEDEIEILCDSPTIEKNAASHEEDTLPEDNIQLHMDNDQMEERVEAYSREVELLLNKIRDKYGEVKIDFF